MREGGEIKNKANQDEPENYRPDLSPEEKLQRQEKRMRTKLYVSRNVEGAPNKEEMRELKELDQEFAKHPSYSYIGAAPFGSAVGGYKPVGNRDLKNFFNKLSDVDITVMYDSDKIEDNETRLLAFAYFAQVCIEKGRESRGRKIISPDIIGVSLDSITKDIRNFSGGGLSSCDILAKMTFAFVGNKINEYREIIARELQKLEPDLQQEAANIITETLAEGDLHSLEKRTKRMRQTSKEQHEEILRERKRMWQKRVQNIWGIGK